MAPVTFVCDLCGAPGRADAPGAAQCQTCGQVALVLGSSGAPAPVPAPEADPFEVARRQALGQGASDGADLALDEEAVERRPARLASLWVAPGRIDGTAPGTQSLEVPRRTRKGRRPLAALATLAAGGALALGAAAVLGAFDADEPAEPAAVAPPDRSAHRL
ncbi:MAG TPA: hypothetical protein VLS93_13745, partial [Anaeromyxobacteraceae bacterium]|nr:hypothetical protein [Anaeromyxobacteraceae bacterium]